MAVVRGRVAFAKVACALAVAGAVPLLGGPAAQAAGTGTAGLRMAEPGVQQAQYYRQEPYGGGYGQDRYGQDRYEQDRDRGDRYGRDRDDRYGQGRQEGYGRGGGGVGGSYQASCEGARQNGSTLTAVCRDGRGNRVESSIDLNRCRGSDVANAGGYLRCGNVQGSGGRIR